MMVDNLYIIDVIIIHDDREQEIYIVSVSSSSSSYVLLVVVGWYLVPYCTNEYDIHTHSIRGCS
jgi:hypothetical protein